MRAWKQVLLSIMVVAAAGCAVPSAPPPPPAAPAPVTPPVAAQPANPGGAAVAPAKVSEYFPARAGSVWEYAGFGNEYATFTRRVQHVKGDLVQLADDNGGTVVAAVFRIGPEAVQRILSRGEQYDGTSLLEAKPADPPTALIKAPLKVGLAWEGTPGKDRREIIAVGETVQVPAGTYADVLRIRVTHKESTGVVEESYARNVGLIKVLFRDQGDIEVRSELKRYAPGP